MGFYTPGAELLAAPLVGLLAAAVSFLVFWVAWSTVFRRRGTVSVPAALGLALLPALALASLVGAVVAALLYFAWFA